MIAIIIIIAVKNYFVSTEQYVYIYIIILYNMTSDTISITSYPYVSVLHRIRYFILFFKTNETPPRRRVAEYFATWKNSFGVFKMTIIE